MFSFFNQTKAAILKKNPENIVVLVTKRGIRSRNVRQGNAEFREKKHSFETKTKQQDEFSRKPQFPKNSMPSSVSSGRRQADKPFKSIKFGEKVSPLNQSKRSTRLSPSKFQTRESPTPRNFQRFDNQDYKRNPGQNTSGPRIQSKYSYERFPDNNQRPSRFSPSRVQERESPTPRNLHRFDNIRQENKRNPRQNEYSPRINSKYSYEAKNSSQYNRDNDRDRGSQQYKNMNIQARDSSTRLNSHRINNVRQENRGNPRENTYSPRIDSKYSYEAQQNSLQYNINKDRFRSSQQEKNIKIQETRGSQRDNEFAIRRKFSKIEDDSRTTTRNKMNSMMVTNKSDEVALRNERFSVAPVNSLELMNKSENFSVRNSNNDIRKNIVKTEIRNPKLLFPPTTLDVFITCQPGLENVLSQECNALGLHHKISRGGIILISTNERMITVEDIMICHLYLGTASSILLRCGLPFTSRALGELKRKVENLPWNQIIHPQLFQKQRYGSEKGNPINFKVKVTSAKSRLLHSTAVRDQVLDGIYASLGLSTTRYDKENVERKDLKNNDDNNESVVPLVVHVFRDKVQISIDTSITPIHQRMYKLETGKAPLREDIAYAFLYSAGWKPDYNKFPIVRSESKMNNQSDLVQQQYGLMLDTFCGSGAIPIEAAGMLHGLPPGRLRPAPFYGTVLYNPTRWNFLVNQALQNSIKNRSPSTSDQIVASDRDAGVIDSLIANADRAGVLDMIQVHHCAFSSNPWFDKPMDMIDTLNDRKHILIASNLPFGRRIRASSTKNNRTNELLPLYQSIRKYIAQLENLGCNASATLLTDDINLVRRSGFGSQTDAVLTTKHGGLNVFGMYRKSICK